MSYAAVAPVTLPDFTTARHNMVESQLRPNTVRDERVLDLFENLPRELFVPENLTGVAYIDENLPVAPGRFLIQPMVLARLVVALGLTPEHNVLEIGPATGYSTVVLASMAKQVLAIDSDADLQRRAKAMLAALQITNADVRVAPMVQGWKPGAPFDAILINGAVDDVPEALLLQLKDGGRLAAVVRNYAAAHVAHTGEARLYERSGKVMSYRPLFDANVPLLPGFVAEAGFVF